MDITITPTFTRISGRVPVEAVDLLSTTLRYRERGYVFTYAYKYGRSDGWKSLLYQQGGHFAFPTGLLPRVLGPLHQELGISPTMADETPYVQSGPIRGTLPDGTALFPDQVQAITTACMHRRGLLSLATNYGKTLIAAGICAAFAAQRALILVSTRALLAQTTRKLEGFLQESVGAVGAGARRLPSTRVTVATVQTLRQLQHRHRPATLQWLEQQAVLIADECHMIAPRSWFPILGACPASIRIGMSGTVREAPHQVVEEAFFGPVLMEVRGVDLVEAGRSATPTIYMPYTGALLRQSLEYRDLYEAGVVHNAARNRLILDATETVAHKGLRALVLVYRVQHGEVLAAGLRAKEVRTAWVHGQSPPHAVTSAVSDLTGHRLDAIVASGIFQTGIDVPEFEAIINAAAWKSALSTKQKLGRGLRRKPQGANRVVIVDPWDLGNDILKRHSQSRQRTYEREGYTVRVGPWEDLKASLASL